MICNSTIPRNTTVDDAGDTLIYDGWNRLIAVNGSSGHSLSVQYAYATGNTFTTGSRIVSMTYPSGEVLDYNYGTSAGLNDVIGRLDNIVGPDGAGGSGTVTLESYTYMGLSTVVEMDHPQDGVNLTYLSNSTTGDAGDAVVGLDRFGRIDDQKWTTGTNGASGTIEDEYQYTYDEDGNVLTKTNVVADNASNTSFDLTYTYNGLNELTSAYNGTSNVQSYTLDALGNITSQTNGTSSAVTSTFNAQNELTTDGSANLAFDNDGNTITDDSGNTDIYNAWNQLIAVNNTAGTTIAVYAYDGAGRRDIQIDNGGTPLELYYDSADQMIDQEADNSGLHSQSTYFWSPGSGYPDALIARDDNFNMNGSYNLNDRVYAIYDANFDVTALVGHTTLPGDADGSSLVDGTDEAIFEAHFGQHIAGGAAVGDFNDDGVVDNADFVVLSNHFGLSTTSSTWSIAERIVYTPEGQFQTYSNTFVSQFDFEGVDVGFQGLLYDYVTGDNFADRRFYRASMGRWGSVDPIRAGRNWYQLDDGNPINYTDPSGLQATGPATQPVVAPIEKISIFICTGQQGTDVAKNWQKAWGGLVVAPIANQASIEDITKEVKTRLASIVKNGETPVVTDVYVMGHSVAGAQVSSFGNDKMFTQAYLDDAIKKVGADAAKQLMAKNGYTYNLNDPGVGKLIQDMDNLMGKPSWHFLGCSGTDHKDLFATFASILGRPVEVTGQDIIFDDIQGLMFPANMNGPQGADPNRSDTPLYNIDSKGSATSSGAMTQTGGRVSPATSASQPAH